MRIVTLTCSNTEIVAALGRGDWIVGVDDHSDYPPDVVARASRVGPDLGVDVSKVAALEPDLVFASLTVPGHERVVANLEQAGLPVVVSEPIRVGDVYADIRSFARLLNVEARAEALVAKMRAELEHESPPGPRPRVLVEWWPKPVIVPGRDSWVTELIELAGGTNPFANRPVKSSPITDEEAGVLRPDAVVIAWCGVRLEKYRPDVVYRRPGWRGFPALVQRRVYCVPEAFLGRPGPRLVDGCRALRAIVNECIAGGGSPTA